MPSFEINKEHAIDLIIFWVTGIDGTLNYDELKEADQQLQALNYDPKEFHGRTMNHLSSLNSEQISDLINEAKQYVASHFDSHEKDALLFLIKQIIQADGIVSNAEEDTVAELEQLLC